VEQAPARLIRMKYSSLFRLFASGEEKKFYKIDTSDGRTDTKVSENTILNGLLHFKNFLLKFSLTGEQTQELLDYFVHFSLALLLNYSCCPIFKMRCH
jgi:hypothetical protein